MMDDGAEEGDSAGHTLVVIMGPEKDEKEEEENRKSGIGKGSMRFCSFLLLLLLMMSLVVSSADAQGSLQTDVMGLQVFRNAVDPTRKLLSSWENATQVCVSWAGVSCERGRVYKLRLPGAGLAGSIPSGSLSLLDQLRVLSLHHNMLTGAFPEEELANCTNLQALFLDNNGFSGPLSSSSSSSFWGLWHRLTHLSLSFNKLNGPIPDSINAFSHLVVLDLQNNSFSGYVPVLKLVNLTRFSVANNNLSGPVPSTLIQFPLSSWIGNQGICGPPTTVPCRSLPPPPRRLLPPPPSAPSSRRNSVKRLGTGVEVGIVLGGIAVLVLITIALLLCHWKRTGRQAEAAKQHKEDNPKKQQQQYKVDNPKKQQQQQHKDDHDSAAICGQAAAVQERKRVKGKSAAAAAKDVSKSQQQQQLKEERNNKPIAGSQGKRVRGRSRSSAVVAAADAVKDKPEGEEEEHQDYTIAEHQGLQERSSKLVLVQGTRFSFGLEDLLRASAEVVGKGTAGTAYKAILDDTHHHHYAAAAAHAVAGGRGGGSASSSPTAAVFVKRLKDATLARKDFQLQIDIVAKLKHPNLVPLHAYFFSKEEKLLVYDYYSLGSLSSHLHGNNRTCLDWVSRCKIALGAALGIACIHEGGRGGGSDGGCMYVHGNIKSSNVLLNSCMEVGISDFGLLQLLANSPVASRIVGYQAPEVAQTGELTPQSDVYSFGVLLLELLTGKAPVQSLMNDEGSSGNLPHWVQSVVREVWIAKVFDAELKKYHNIEEEMMQMLQVAMVCVDDVPDMRPTMVEVVHMLQEIHPVVLDMRDNEEEAPPSRQQQPGSENKSQSGPQSARYDSQSYTPFSY
jgi:hypothetical protein